jgi:Flp pilus assembly protein TadB
MQDVMIDALQIVGVCLLIAIIAVALAVFRPTARRRRRRKRHGQRNRIDLFAPARTEAPTEPDA